MSSKVIVFTADRYDRSRGEITVLDRPEEAERLVASLLENGLEADCVRVFSGDEMQVHVAHKPLVTLVPGFPAEVPSGNGSGADGPAAEAPADSPQGDPHPSAGGQREVPFFARSGGEQPDATTETMPELHH